MDSRTSTTPTADSRTRGHSTSFGVFAAAVAVLAVIVAALPAPIVGVATGAAVLLGVVVAVFGATRSRTSERDAPRPAPLVGLSPLVPLAHDPGSQRVMSHAIR